MSVQTTTIEIDQLTAARLQAQAEAQGVTLAAPLRSITELWNGTHEKSFYETASLPEAVDGTLALIRYTIDRSRHFGEVMDEEAGA